MFFYGQSLPNTFLLGKSLKLKYLQSILSDTDNFGLCNQQFAASMVLFYSNWIYDLLKQVTVL